MRNFTDMIEILFEYIILFQYSYIERMQSLLTITCLSLLILTCSCFSLHRLQSISLNHPQEVKLRDQSASILTDDNHDSNIITLQEIEDYAALFGVRFNQTTTGPYLVGHLL